MNQDNLYAFNAFVNSEMSLFASLWSIGVKLWDLVSHDVLDVGEACSTGRHDGTYQRCLLGFGCSPDSTVVFIRNPVKIYGFPPPLIQLGVFGRVSVRHIVCPIGTPLFVAWAYCLAAKAAAVPFLYIIFVYLVVGLRVKGPRKSVYK